MRLIDGWLIVSLLALSVPCAAQTRPSQRDARAAAEALIRPSGPVRSVAQDITPHVWRAAPEPVGTYRDPTARHRFTRYTYGWRGYGWYCHTSYGYLQPWYGCR